MYLGIYVCICIYNIYTHIGSSLSRIQDVLGCSCTESKQINLFIKMFTAWQLVLYVNYGSFNDDGEGTYVYIYSCVHVFMYIFEYMYLCISADIQTCFFL
jgi:hypothetical protein